ncbi:MAG: CoA transferase [Dehalococcoidia bacterium]|nr:CoA transferase [Dehalococcoidia bacterium]
MDDGVLAGIRVLEIGGGVPAAFATRWMAGFGADVVRTESTPGKLTDDEAVYLLTGKRRIKTDAATVQRLALAADIVVEDRKPGTTARVGLDPERLRSEKPALTVVSITPYGQTGPYADFEATNITSFAMGGIMSLTGMHQREPLVTGGSQALYLGGLNAFGAAVAAYLGSLIQGKATGSTSRCRSAWRGCWNSTDREERTKVWRAYEAGTTCEQHGACIHAPMASRGVCALERQIPALFSVLGDPDLDDERFRNPLERPNHDDELQAKLYGWFGERTKAEILELGARYKVPFGAVQAPGDLLANETLRERGFFDEVATGNGTARIPGRPFLGLAWRAGQLSEPGADTVAVIDEWLGEGR